jgi:hypothetical protein
MLARPLAWLITDWQWPALALGAGLFLLLLAPIWVALLGLPLALVFVQLPVYMLHQYEEHAGDRFRTYINSRICGGREGLTPTATFWINSLGVWLVDLVSLYLACFIDLGLGLIAIYLPLVNSLGHVLPAIGKREYNPGLWTSLVLFLPVGIWSLVVVGADRDWVWHIVGLAAAVLVHAAILVIVISRLKQLAAHGQTVQEVKSAG